MECTYPVSRADDGSIGFWDSRAHPFPEYVSEDRDDGAGARDFRHGAVCIVSSGYGHGHVLASSACDRRVWLDPVVTCRRMWIQGVGGHRLLHDTVCVVCNGHVFASSACCRRVWLDLSLT
eukprot:7055477-Alexandrium_andersonii.AAC.1